MEMQSDFQSLRTDMSKLKHSSKVRGKPAAPLKKPGFQAQVEFNNEVLAIAADIRDSLHDPDDAEACLKKLEAKLNARNTSLGIADEVTGVLSLIDRVNKLSQVESLAMYYVSFAGFIGFIGFTVKPMKPMKRRLRRPALRTTSASPVSLVSLVLLVPSKTNETNETEGRG